MEVVHALVGFLHDGSRRLIGIQNPRLIPRHTQQGICAWYRRYDGATAEKGAAYSQAQ